MRLRAPAVSPRKGAQYAFAAALLPFWAIRAALRGYRLVFRRLAAAEKLRRYAAPARYAIGRKPDRIRCAFFLRQTGFPKINAAHQFISSADNDKEDVINAGSKLDAESDCKKQIIDFARHI